MGQFKEHLPCPRCGSRDNLGVWTDGSWCFGCGLTIPGYRGMSTEDLKKQIDYNDKKEKKKCVVYLPTDFTLSIPQAPLEWLKKYGITDNERLAYKIGWSEDERSLVFPAFDLYANLLLVQLRGFPEKSFYTRGFPESVVWTAAPAGSTDLPNGRSISVVEDFISAIRVGRTMEATPLWGSQLSLNQVRRLSDRYEHLFLWLDYDKAGHAMKLRIKSLPYFKSVSVIVTEKDPKDYTDEYIAQTLGVIP